MKTATFIRADGITQKVKPKDGKSFSLDELQKFVGGFIEIVPTKKAGKVLVIDDEGKLKTGAKRNALATELYDGFSAIVGNALLVDEDLIN